MPRSIFFSPFITLHSLDAIESTYAWKNKDNFGEIEKGHRPDIHQQKGCRRHLHWQSKLQAEGREAVCELEEAEKVHSQVTYYIIMSLEVEISNFKAVGMWVFTGAEIMVLKF